MCVNSRFRAEPLGKGGKYKIERFARPESVQSSLLVCYNKQLLVNNLAGKN